MKRQKYSKPKYGTKFIRVRSDDWFDPNYDMSDHNSRRKLLSKRPSGSPENYRQHDKKLL